MAASVCGFSYGRNLINTSYPVVQAIRSVLPLCDEFVFVVGKGEDDTRGLIASIDPRIRIVDSVWQESGKAGEVFLLEGRKAMDAAAATGCTWGLHLFCDEVYHEDDLPLVRAACQGWGDNPEVKALLFKFLNFVFDYRSIDPWMYRKVSRIYKLDGSTELVGDGCGPALKNYRGSANPYLDKHHLGGHVRWAAPPSGGAKARIFHYNWVRSPEQMRAKISVMEDHYWGDLPKDERARKAAAKFDRFMTKYDALRNFTGTHPAVMRELVAAWPPLKPHRNRWLSPRFYQECFRHGVKL